MSGKKNRDKGTTKSEDEEGEGRQRKIKGKEKVG